MAENITLVQTKKRSIAALVLMIISFTFVFVNTLVQKKFAIANFEWGWFLFIQIAPMVLLAVYILVGQEKQRATVLVPLAFIALTLYVFSSIIAAFSADEPRYGEEAQQVIGIFQAIICFIPMLIFSIILIPAAFKGLRKTGLIVAFSVFSFIFTGLEFIALLINMEWYDFVGGKYFLFDFLEMLTYILFPISLIIFASNGNIPPVGKSQTAQAQPTAIPCPVEPQQFAIPQHPENAQVAAPVAISETVVTAEESPAAAAPETSAAPKFCPACGTKFADTDVFCANCGHKR